MRAASTCYHKAEELADHGDMEGALTEYHSTLDIQQRLTPDSLLVAMTHSKIASLLLSCNKFCETLCELQNKLAIGNRLAPGSLVVAETCDDIGVVFAKQNDRVGALVAFKNALEIKQHLEPDSPSVATTYVSIGHLLDGSQGDVDTVLAHFRKALFILERQELPDSLLVAKLHFDIGRILKGEGELVGAMESLTRAKDALNQTDLEETDPRILYCILMIGEVQLAFRDYDRAMGITETLIRLAPGFADAYGLKASIWFGRGDFDKAKEARRQQRLAS